MVSWSAVAALALFSVLWLDLIRQLSYTWETREQYAYGWFVPFLALGLFLKKWPTRPKRQNAEILKAEKLKGEKAEKANRETLRTERLKHEPKSSQYSAGSEFQNLSFSEFGRISAFQRFGLSAFVFLVCLALLPLRVIHEINQDWPLITWPLTLCVVFLTLYAIHLAGENAETLKTEKLKGETAVNANPESLKTEKLRIDTKSGSAFQRFDVSAFQRFRISAFQRFPWLSHFAFPICFILVAVAWPYRIEHGLTQGLMRVVANFTVELLGWMNIPAMQHGNLIEVSTGTVGVDEACSGIRSFQSTLMAGLFLGELYLMRFWRRVGLVVIGLTLAFAFNVVRTLFLTWQASKEGIDAIDKWHDSAGMTIFLVSFACLWGLAALLNRKAVQRTTGLQDQGTKGLQDYGTKGQQDHETTGPQDPALAGLQNYGTKGPKDGAEEGPQDYRTTGQPDHKTTAPKEHGPVVPLSSSPVVRSDSPVVPWSRGPVVPSRQRFSVSAFSFLLCVGLWSLVCIGATEAWYRSSDIDSANSTRWTLQLPKALAVEELTLPSRTAEILQQDEAIMGRWEEKGAQWTAYWFRWKPGSMQSVIKARGHRPEACLPAAGLKQISGPQAVDLDAGSLTLPFQKYEFDLGGTRIYVFFCLWEDGQDRQLGMRTIQKEDRIEWVLTRRRNLGQQTLELILTGCESLEAAEQAVRERLPQLVRVKQPLDLSLAESE